MDKKKRETSDYDGVKVRIKPRDLGYKFYLNNFTSFFSLVFHRMLYQSDNMHGTNSKKKKKLFLFHDTIAIFINWQSLWCYNHLNAGDYNPCVDKYLMFKQLLENMLIEIKHL